MSESHPHTTPNPPPPTRRSFLEWGIHGLGALFALVLGVPALAYLIDARNRPARAGAFKPVARLSDLKIGAPTEAVVAETSTDAWTLYPNDLVGRVWLIRRSTTTVDAYTTICPHEGCSVNWVKDAGQFKCPCHGGVFDLQGNKVSGPPPRGMDKLECQLNQDDPDNVLVLVKYEKFIKNQAAKEVET
jgi:Rieske Fe-S protein